jgi:amino acid transporter
MEQGKLKRKLSLLDLTFLGLGAIIGSGWLLGAQAGANDAGPSAWIAWVIGGIAVLLIGLVYAELGGALPRAGGIIRYPEYSHGPLVAGLMGFAALLAYSSVASIEAEAMRQYTSHWWVALQVPGPSNNPTFLGWVVQFALLLLFFLINYWSVNVFGKVNSVMTAVKFIVPLLTVIVLFTHFKGQNFSSHGFAPYGFSGIELAVATGGIVFSYLGFRQAVDFAAEAKNPQRTVPLAIILAIVLGGALYILLQLVFIGGVTPGELSHGWANVNLTAPYAQIASALGIGWLATLVFADAAISPSGTANIYLSSTARVIYSWSKTSMFFPLFKRLSKVRGLPRPALILSFLLAILFTLPFPSWTSLVGVISSATVTTYVIGPVSAAAFRLTAKDLKRPFRLPGLWIIAPLAYIIAALIIYWTGWDTIRWLIGAQVVVWLIYLAVQRYIPKDRVAWAEQFKASIWLIVFYIVLLAMSYFGQPAFQGDGKIPAPWDQIIVAVAALGAFIWGVRSALRQNNIYDETDEEALPDIAGV